MNNADLVAEGPNNNNNNQNGKEPKKRGLFGTYLKYGFMPGFGERFKRLGLQLGHFAYLLAMVYGAVRLIKPGHPVLNPVNIGKFGFRDVVSAAAENVIISKQTIDQVLIFGAVLLGIALVVFQFVAILVMAGADFYINMAQAQDIGSMFTVEDPTKDLGLIGLEMMFGTDLFEAAAPSMTIVAALHTMLAFFSYAMLLIAVFLLIYYVFVVVGEAAISGTPFGRRFNGFYAPIRLCLAFGLLIPVAGGLNVAQYTTLWVAKMGSNMASNAWSVFSTEFFSPKNFAAAPSGPALEEFVGAVFINELCAYAHNELDNSGSNPTIERRVRIRNAAGRGYSSKALEDFSVRDADVNNSRTLTIHWSSKHEDDASPNSKCGSIRMYTSSDDINGFDLLNAETLNAVRNSYFTVLSELITDLNAEGNTLPGVDGAENILDAIIKLQSAASGGDSFGEGDLGGAEMAGRLVNDAHVVLSREVSAALETIKSDEGDALAREIAARGWVGAASNFNIIARVNAAIYEALNEPIPTIYKEPTIVNEIARAQAVNTFLSYIPFAPRVNEPSEVVKETVQVMAVAGEWFGEGLEAAEEARNRADKSGEKGRVMKAVGKVVRSAFGFEMVVDYSANPMGQLSMMGKSLMDKSLFAFGSYAVVVAGLGLIPGVTLGPTVATVAAGLVNFIVGIGLTAGFILYFMVPMLPFMYFLFAVVGWLSEIFEAIVAMPLWALAHIRIDGDGLPGQAASGGYYLIFMIFIRPIMIVFGLIGAYVSFSVGVFILNQLFATTVMNAASNDDGMMDLASYTGGLVTYTFNTGGVYDAIGFTVLYVIIVYNMANSSFKLIDAVPNQILRWMGNSTPSFSDGRNVDLGTMQGVAAYAANNVVSSASQGATGFIAQNARSGQENRQARQQADMERQRHESLLNALRDRE